MQKLLLIVAFTLGIIGLLLINYNHIGYGLGVIFLGIAAAWKWKWWPILREYIKGLYEGHEGSKK